MTATVTQITAHPGFKPRQPAYRSYGGSIAKKTDFGYEVMTRDEVLYEMTSLENERALYGDKHPLRRDAVSAKMDELRAAWAMHNNGEIR